MKNSIIVAMLCMQSMVYAMQPMNHQELTKAIKELNKHGIYQLIVRTTLLITCLEENKLINFEPSCSYNKLAHAMFLYAQQEYNRQQTRIVKDTGLLSINNNEKSDIASILRHMNGTLWERYHALPRCL